MIFLVVGCGSIGKRHIRNLITLDAGRIIANDVQSLRCHEVEREFGIETFKDFNDALAQKPDATIICTPPSLHLPLALSAARNACHLFIEKPLSHSLDGVDQLLKTVQDNELVTLVGCNMRFHPSILKIKELLDDEAIGKVFGARLAMGQYLPDWHPCEDYREGYSANQRLGGGIILDSIHELDYISWFLGKVARVFCFGDKLSYLEIDTEDLAEILLYFDSGIIAEVHLDYVQRSYDRSCELIGEQGTIKWDAKDNQVRVYSTKTSEWQMHSQNGVYDTNQMYIEEMKHFLRCLNGEEQSMQDIVTGKDILGIALAAKESAKSGTVITL